MKKFEVGKMYSVNAVGNKKIIIDKVTREYITFHGDFSGRKKINRVFDDGLFGLGEYILISAGKKVEYMCFARMEVI